jgi:hypothetical protein
MWSTAWHTACQPLTLIPLQLSKLLRDCGRTTLRVQGLWPTPKPETLPLVACLTPFGCAQHTDDLAAGGLGALLLGLDATGLASTALPRSICCGHAAHAKQRGHAQGLVQAHTPWSRLYGKQSWTQRMSSQPERVLCVWHTHLQTATCPALPALLRTPSTPMP